MSNEPIIVTGCSGFVGRNVVKSLLKQGKRVIGFSRTNPNIIGMEFKSFDITDLSNYDTDEYETATIINTAIASSGSSYELMKRTNYEAVLNLLSLNPKGKFIHVSSSSIYDLGKPSEMEEEDEFSETTYNFYNPYSTFKAKAEAAILSGVAERAIQPVTLRPHAIYGPDDTTLMPALLARIKSGKIRLPEAGKVMHSLTHIDNLVQAVNLSLEYSSAQPEAFNITDAAPVSIAHAVDCVSDADIEIKGVPTQLLLGVVGKILRVPPYEVRQLGFERTYDLSKAVRMLGYEPSEFNINWKK